MSLTLGLLLHLQGELAPPVLPPRLPAAVADACPAAGAPVVRRLDPGGIRYCGRIDQTGVAQIGELLRAGDTRLVISSVGGELEAPLELAELILRRGLDVEVAGPCFSACASIVFVAGRRRIVSPTGVLGFHNTSTSAFMLASHLYGEREDSGLASLRRRSAAEVGLYARRGVDPTLLVRPQVEIATICVARAGTSRDGETVFNLTSQLDLWAPDLITLRLSGIELTGSYPNHLGDVQQRLDRYLGPAEGHFRFIFGGRGPSSPAIYRRLYATPVC